MAYTNSKLVNCTVKSPNHSGTRTHSIDRITPHCVVGQLSAENIGHCFSSSSVQASCNYGIGTEGKVCLVVDEEKRSWCTSSKENDQRAVTIECACDKTAPYAFNSIVYEKLIDLCEDICRRNNKTKLIWFGDKEKTLSYQPASNEMVLTVHRWYANKSCPGDWMYSRMGDLATRVSERLGTVTQEQANMTKDSNFPATPFSVKVGTGLDYRINPSFDCKAVGNTGKGTFTIVEVENSWGRLLSGAGWVWLGDVQHYSMAGTNVENKQNGVSYKVKVSINDLNIRKGPGTDYEKNGICPAGIYTVIEESSGKGATKWGKLKSGAGWVSLDYAKRI